MASQKKVHKVVQNAGYAPIEGEGIVVAYVSSDRDDMAGLLSGNEFYALQMCRDELVLVPFGEWSYALKDYVALSVPYGSIAAVEVAREDPDQQRITIDMGNGAIVFSASRKKGATGGAGYLAATNSWHKDNFEATLAALAALAPPSLGDEGPASQAGVVIRDPARNLAAITITSCLFVAVAMVVLVATWRVDVTAFFYVALTAVLVVAAGFNLVMAAKRVGKLKPAMSGREYRAIKAFLVLVAMMLSAVVGICAAVLDRIAVYPMILSTVPVFMLFLNGYVSYVESRIAQRQACAALAPGRPSSAQGQGEA